MYKSQGYTQLDTGSTFFRQSRKYGDKVYYVTTNLNTGAFSVEDGEGRIAAAFDPKENKVIPSDQTLYDEIVKNDPGLKNTKAQLLSDTKKIGDDVLENREESGISEQDYNQRIQQERNDTPAYAAIVEEVDVSGSLNNLLASDQIKGKASRNFGVMHYPLTLVENSKNQDFIQFEIGEYKTQSLALGEKSRLGTLGRSIEDTFKSIGTIYLPIQPSISDSNTVDWNENRINPLQVAGLQASSTIINEGSSGITKSLESLKEALTGEDNAALLSAGKLLFAQEAVGAQNVLSRFGGAVLNPNLELLFNGPQLRPFSFNFRLSPREAREAQNVRRIIRTFKEAMAVKKTQGLFLAAPNIFKIQYIQGSTGNPHPSLNLIKTCALKACVVDYTPENSYMTFNDNENTMVSYDLRLDFQELEPITDQDYVRLNNEGQATLINPDHIGY